MIATAATIIPIAIIGAARIPFSSDILRVRLIDALEQRLNVDAELDSLTLRFHPSLRAVGRGLILRAKDQSDAPPLIAVDTFTVDANLGGLWKRQVSFVRLEGLSIQIPPGQDTIPVDDADPQPPSNSAPSDYLKQVSINDVYAPDAKLIVLRSDASKPPRTWSLHQLHVQHVSFGTRMPFETVLTNAVPPGDIKAAGTFGPWHIDDPGKTPLDGQFTFDNADLSVFDGVGGTLSAAGTFRGALNRIDITGETDTPDFVVTSGGHKVELKASYHAIVDATNGNTTLDPVNASFRNTSVVARGGVYEKTGVKGRIVDLNVTITEGRLEDIMYLAVPAPRAPMNGLLRLNTRFVIPPGKRDIVDKLQLDGRFTIQRGRFTDSGVQKKVNELSRRASVDDDATSAQASVGSNFEGRFILGDGNLRLPAVSFNVPGALVALHGQYGMRGEQIAFDGNLYMDAKISQTVTGLKSLLLKAVDPLFRRNGKTVVPLRISGSRAEPKFGVDFGRIFRRSSLKSPKPAPLAALPQPNPALTN